MPSRRHFLGAMALPAGLVLAPSDPAAVARALAAFADLEDPPQAAAGNEDLWLEVQRAFTVDRSVINLNNGGVSPAPVGVQESMRRHLEFSNQTPSHNLWTVLQPRVESVRTGLADLFGCDPEEVAITRNASESLQTCQLGFDLEPGDRVLTTTHDYPRMIQTFRQRERRDGIALDQIPLPVPCEDDDLVVRSFEQAITDRTRLILMCHMVNTTGQLLPVKRVVQMARARGIPVIVDGAHSFAHVDQGHAELDCDYYGTSLHKWLTAPHGTGMLFVRRDKIEGLWPLMCPPERLQGDIRKFEEIGTHALASYLAIADAIAFHRGIGPARKEARLRFLRDHWAKRLLGGPHGDRVRLNTSLDPRFSCGIANVHFEGLDPLELRSYLWNKRQILTTVIRNEAFSGLRVSPNVYTTLDELDRFCEVIETVLEKGLPA